MIMDCSQVHPAQTKHHCRAPPLDPGAAAGRVRAPRAQQRSSQHGRVPSLSVLRMTSQEIVSKDNHRPSLFRVRVLVRALADDMTLIAIHSVVTTEARVLRDQNRENNDPSGG